MDLKCEYCRNKKYGANVLPKRWQVVNFRGRDLTFCCDRHKKIYVENGDRDWRSR